MARLHSICGMPRLRTLARCWPQGIAGLHASVNILTSSWGDAAMRDSMSTNFGDTQ
jgi:hypothetical protein